MKSAVSRDSPNTRNGRWISVVPRDCSRIPNGTKTASHFMLWSLAFTALRPRDRPPHDDSLILTFALVSSEIRNVSGCSAASGSCF